jgi:hypothetical protein
MSNQIILPIEIIHHILSFRPTHPIISDFFKEIVKLYEKHHILGHEKFDKFIIHFINHKNKQYSYERVNGIYKKILI